jgi:hypothetical protein
MTRPTNCAPILPLAAFLLSASLAAQPAAALPLISELFYDAVGSDDGQSFVEIHGTPGTVLDGYSVELVNGADGAVATTLALVGVIGPSGLYLLADRFADGTTAVPGADHLLNFDLQNGPDSLVLRGPEGVVDALGFGEFGPTEVFAGEGSPAPDVPAGSSLARHFANLDTDDNALDFGELLVPTPGTAQLVPEPGTALLSAAGLSGLASLGRRDGRTRRCAPAQ